MSSRGRRWRVALVVAAVGASTVLVAGPATARGAAASIPAAHPGRIATVPGAPVFTMASGANHGATLGWQASTTGGSPITSYVLTPYINGVSKGDLPVGSAEAHVTVVVSGLLNGSIYRFKVAARNAVGTGPQSTYSGPVLPPFDSLSSFVDQQYRDFVARPASVSEKQTGVADLAGGAAPGSVMLKLRHSQDNAVFVDPVTRLYFAYFLRIPDAGGLRHWIGRKRAGVSLITISEAFASSKEFVDRYGSLTNRAFVNLVYQNVLGRAPDQAGSDFWTGQLDSHAKSRGEVMAGFSESSEHKTKRAPSVDVAVTWIDMVLVSPGQAAFDSWVTKLTTGGKTVTDLADYLLATASYAQRFP